ncbi:TIM barrel protein [Candidatus Woesearchaeota archaeon]|nr:TIM barrel protein [Candidatus Woesearchaeota archaeon]
MLLLGPAGSEGLGNIEGIRKAHSLGARVYEVEFTHGVNMSIAQAREINKLREELGMIITVHAPYFINLLSPDKVKRAASKKRILDSCKLGNEMNAKWIVFHPGFYGKLDKDEAYDIMLQEMGELKDAINELGYTCKLAPETTGKISQWGDLDEILRISKQLKIGMCIDFAHLKARHQGRISFEQVLEKLPKSFHAHFSGIEYGEKGEKRHIEVDIKEFKKLARLILKKNKNVTMINESPYIFRDLERMIKALKEIK